MKAALVAVLLTAALAPADSWLPPTRQKYFSKDRTYRVEVIPANPAASAKTSTARAVFSARGALGLYRTRASFALLNQIAPTGAIVSGDGKHLATVQQLGQRRIWKRCRRDLSHRWKCSGPVRFGRPLHDGRSGDLLDIRQFPVVGPRPLFRRSRKAGAAVLQQRRMGRRGHFWRTAD